jgi:hypothetical protein
MEEEPKIRAPFIDARPPFVYALTTKGELTIEWGIDLPLGAPQVRMGVVIPAGEVETLRRCLEVTQTIQETLSAKKPEQGAH